MARINKNGTLSGLMGNVVMRSYNNQTFACVRPSNVSNPQTRRQMLQRTKKQNIVNLYSSMKPVLKDNFQGKVGRQSDYTMFVSCNLSQAPIYLTQREASLDHTQVVAPYMVSFGKLSPIAYHFEDGWLISNIKIEHLIETEDTKIYDLSTSILTRNDDWKEGDILEFICCYQKSKPATYTNETTPYAECDYANITLDKGDHSRLKKLLDDIELKVNEEGYLCMRASGEGGFAMVHKRLTAKGMAVSTQNMIVNSTMLEYYQSGEQCEKAINSYMKKR